MNSARPVFIAVGLVLGGQLAFAQDVSRYRAYALESSLDSVVAATGARAVDAKTLHERPATIQELDWRAPYVDSRNTLADRAVCAVAVVDRRAALTRRITRPPFRNVRRRHYGYQTAPRSHHRSASRRG
jgi:hypothetical protein